VTALLREGMEFEGLIVSDALDMGALANEYPPDEIAVRAVEAGMDILLHPADPRKTVDAVVKAVEQGRLTEERIQESVDRILAWKKKLGLFTPLHPPLARGESKGGVLARGAKEGGASQKIDYARHRKIADQLAAKALKVLAGQKTLASFGAGKGVSCFIVDDDGTQEGGPFRDALLARFGDVRAVTLDPGTGREGLEPHLEPGGPGPVVVAVFSKIAASKGHSGILPQLRDRTFEVIRRAKAARKPVAVISFDSPYLLDQFKDADVLIAGYDRMDAIQRAAAQLLAGTRDEIRATR